MYAQNVAEQIKDSYTPFTGKNVRGSILDFEYDLAEVNHVKYGLFDANEWKVKARYKLFIKKK